MWRSTNSRWPAPSTSPRTGTWESGRKGCGPKRPRTGLAGLFLFSNQVKTPSLPRRLMSRFRGHDNTAHQVVGLQQLIDWPATFRVGDVVGEHLVDRNTSLRAYPAQADSFLRVVVVLRRVDCRDAFIQGRIDQFGDLRRRKAAAGAMPNVNIGAARSCGRGFVAAAPGEAGGRIGSGGSTDAAAALGAARWPPRRWRGPRAQRRTKLRRDNKGCCEPGENAMNMSPSMEWVE